LATLTTRRHGAAANAVEMLFDDVVVQIIQPEADGFGDGQAVFSNSLE